MTISCFLSGLCTRAKILKFKDEKLAHLLLPSPQEPAQKAKSKEPIFTELFLKIKTKLAGYSIILLDEIY